MTTIFTRSVTLSASPQQVWDGLTRWQDAPQWMKGIDRLSPPDEAVGLGTRLRFQARGEDRTSEISAWDPPRSMAIRTVQGTIVAEYRYTVSAPEAGEGTRLTLVADCEVRGWVGWMVGPFVRQVIRRTDGDQLEDFQAYLASNVP